MYKLNEIQSHLIDVMGYSTSEVRNVDQLELESWVDSEEGLQNYTFRDDKVNNKLN